MNTRTFQLASPFKPTGDQPEAIQSLVSHLASHREQVLIGVTGSGKTYTMAHVIASAQRPTLIISHNKTLAAQLYQEFRDFFPHNAVSYFVSYYDYYQPESYIPQTNTYIEKETEINETIDMLRLAATTNLLTRPDTIVVASVSCIYTLGSPKEYGQYIIELRKDMPIERNAIIRRLVDLQYTRNNWNFLRSTFRVRGEAIDIFPSYDDYGIRMRIANGKLTELSTFNPATGHTVAHNDFKIIYPAKHYMIDSSASRDTFNIIKNDMRIQQDYFVKQKKFIEAQRIEQRVIHDIEMIQEIGYVNGIENYSRYFDGRKPGEAPYTLLDYFQESAQRFYGKKDSWLLFIDESHMTIPQIRGMHHGDRSRKQTLIDFGFRLPAALDNRPLAFDEFLRMCSSTIYVSATPDEWEINRSGNRAEQLIRPTGIIDPKIHIRPSDNQIQNLIGEIKKRTKSHERTLVTTLTKQMAEDLTIYLTNHQLRVQYLHSGIDTLKRTDIVAKLRKGDYDVLIGVNLLREGLDLPEVSLVAILNADTSGFLRSKISLIQTMGRAARHVHGEVILYADSPSAAMTEAVDEIERRRSIQLEYNKQHTIQPTSIQKPVRDALYRYDSGNGSDMKTSANIDETELSKLTPFDKQILIKKLTASMKKAGRNMNFEYAITLRDVIEHVKKCI